MQFILFPLLVVRNEGMCVCVGRLILVQIFLGSRINRIYRLGIYVIVVSVKLNINKKLNKERWQCNSNLTLPKQ